MAIDWSFSPSVQGETTSALSGPPYLFGFACLEFFKEVKGRLSGFPGPLLPSAGSQGTRPAHSALEQLLHQKTVTG